MRRTAEGKFVQLAISSAATDPEAEAKNERSGLDAYGPDLVALEPNHSPQTQSSHQSLLSSERPYIERYDYADTWGHAVVSIRKGVISATVSSGLALDPWKTWKLTEWVS